MFFVCEAGLGGWVTENYLGKSERNNNGGDVIGRRLNTLVPGS